METQRKSLRARYAQGEVSAYLESISLLLLGITFFAFPFLFTTLTTDFITLPKQILIGVVTLAAILLFGAKMIAEGKTKIRVTPFDLPLLIFTAIVFISALLSRNQADALISFVPFFFAVVLYFIITNLVKIESALLFLASALLGGGVLVSLMAVLSYFKVYILPFPFTQSQVFSPVGSLLDQAIYLALMLPIALYFAYPLLVIKDTSNLQAKSKELGFAIAAVILLTGLGITIFELITMQRPTLLPFETGFQTAFAAISQDAGRVLQGFLFGSGYGTYITDFTRFKLATYNQNQALWTLTFFRSSSFMLELLATTGFLGVVAFLFLIIKVVREHKGIRTIKDNALFVSLVLAIILSFVFPFSFVIQTIFIILLGLFAAAQGLRFSHNRANRFYDIELYFVAFKKGIIALTPMAESAFGMVEQAPTTHASIEAGKSKLMPVIFFIVFTLFSGGLGFLIYQYIASDILFQSSLVTNNGLQTYNNQTNAIGIFKWRDAFYRVYSQTNLALANSLAAAQPRGKQPSQQVQQTIYTLIQQSINAARSAVALSPTTSLNWQNLSSIYRSLIGFGQNAESFSVASSQQAITLDPNNPQLYLNLGGIYYQLGQWENAQRQFQLAINLKPDFANAYYNLGHSFEQKGDIANAIAQYKAVKILVARDQNDLKKISQEIAALEAKQGAGQAQAAGTEPNQAAAQIEPLKISTPSAQLPAQNPKVKIPAPQATTSATKK